MNAAENSVAGKVRDGIASCVTDLNEGMFAYIIRSGNPFFRNGELHFSSCGNFNLYYEISPVSIGA